MESNLTYTPLLVDEQTEKDDITNNEGDLESQLRQSESNLSLFLSNSIQLTNFQLSDDVINTPIARKRIANSQKELIANKNWKRQLFSLSTLICLIQVSIHLYSLLASIVWLMM
jgi:hypothetical protein